MWSRTDGPAHETGERSSMNCPECNAELPDKSKFCPQCGRSMHPPAAEASSRSDRGVKVRVGGWLVLFCALLTVAFPLSGIAGMSAHADLSFRPGVDADSPVLNALGQIALGGLIAGVYAFIAGLRIWLGAPNGKRIAVTFLIAYPLIMLLFNFIAFDMIRNVQGAGQVRGELISSTLGPFLFAAIWLAYFMLSRRVRATYSLRGETSNDAKRAEVIW